MPTVGVSDAVGVAVVPSGSVTVTAAVVAVTRAPPGSRHSAVRRAVAPRSYGTARLPYQSRVSGASAPPPPRE